MKTYYLALDLHDDPDLIAEYRRYHQSDTIWPEVVAHLRNVGVLGEEIYLLGTRMVMVLRTTDEFSFEVKAVLDSLNPKMQAWEELMWKFQKPTTQAKPGEKWVLMEKIFEL